MAPFFVRHAMYTLLVISKICILPCLWIKKDSLLAFALSGTVLFTKASRASDRYLPERSRTPVSFSSKESKKLSQEIGFWSTSLGYRCPNVRARTLAFSSGRSDRKVISEIGNHSSNQIKAVHSAGDQSKIDREARKGNSVRARTSEKQRIFQENRIFENRRIRAYLIRISKPNRSPHANPQIWISTDSFGKAPPS